MSAAVLLVHSRAYACDIGPHVFPTLKFDRVRERMLADGIVDEGDCAEPEPASREDLLRVHTAAYLDDLERLLWTPRTVASELPLSHEIVRAYVLAAGGTTLAARLALESGDTAHLGGGFHHASADRAEGFCYVNDLAVAVRALQSEGLIRRAAIVDLDVHQGNGTALIFENDPSVFTLSLHQEANYPTPKARSDLDVELEDGIEDAAYLERLKPALDRVWEFGPEMVFYQAGADPYREDQLGGLALTIDGLDRRDRAVLEGCAAHGIPAVVTLGGGYARKLDDTVRIHARTCEIAVSLARASLERRAHANARGYEATPPK